MENQTKVPASPIILQALKTDPGIPSETLDCLEIHSVIQRIASTKQMLATIHETGMQTTVAEMYHVLANTLEAAEQKLLEVQGQMEG